MAVVRFPGMALLRSASTSIIEQLRRSGQVGVTFGGKRDIFEACGYERNLTLRMYRDRYNRGDIASRIVEAFPEATWRGTGHDCVFDSEDPDVETPFEKAWNDLNKRLKVWSVLYRGDVLAGLGHYSVVLIGAPGDYNTPLPDGLKPTDIAFLQPFCQEDAPIVDYVMDTRDPRCGQPLTYQLRRISVLRKGIEFTRAPLSLDLARPVHYSRVLHIADGKLDDNVFGTPRLERVWNRVDDLDKVVGAGSESFWQRAHQGMQFDLDPEVELEDDEAKKFRQEIDDYIHHQTRAIRTRGVKMQAFGSDVAKFNDNVAAIISLISAVTKIPQRLLLGSERGELASTQDRDTWKERVQDRRTRFAEPDVLRPFVDRMIDHGALPKPQGETAVRPGPPTRKGKPFAIGKPAVAANPANPADAAANAAKPKPTNPPGPFTRARAAAGFPVDEDPLQIARTDNPVGIAGTPAKDGVLVDDASGDTYECYWDEVLDTPTSERLDSAVKAKTLGATVVTDAEIRDIYLGLEPMSENDLAAAAAAQDAQHQAEIEKMQARGPSPFGPASAAIARDENANNPKPIPFQSAAEHTGLFIYLKLDPEAAKAIALAGAGAETPESLHITVAYCDGDYDKAVPVIESVAAQSPMLQGLTSGIGTFAPSIQSDGKTVLWLRPAVQGLDELHHRVLDALALVGIGQRTPREYQPHITLAYVEPNAEMLLPLIPPTQLYFWQLCIQKGDQKAEFALNGGGFISPAGGY